MPAMRRTSFRGLSYIEVSITAAVLLLLFGAISLIYQDGTQIWRKVDLRTSLLRQVQLVSRTLERDLEITHPFGLARTDSALAYLSGLDANRQISVDPEGRLIWQQFVIVYLDADGRLRQRREFLTPPTVLPPSFRETFGTELEHYLSGPRADDRFLTHSGRITTFRLEPVTGYGSLYELTVEGEELRNSRDVETMSLRTRVSVRNS